MRSIGNLLVACQAAVRRRRTAAFIERLLLDYAQAAELAFGCALVVLEIRQDVSRDLTRRRRPAEIEPLRLIAAGQSNRAIAQELFISPNTVLHHVSSIFAKLGVANRAEAAAYAIRRGLAG